MDKRSAMTTHGTDAIPLRAGILDSKIRLTGIGVLIMACGALAPIQLNLVGEIYAPELLLPLVALIVRFRSGGERGLREPLFTTLLVAGFVTLGGYVLSDLIQGSRPDQYLRGWGRVGLVILDFIGLAVIFGQDRRNLWWYALGSGLGGILFLRLVMHAPLVLWKFGYADPVLETSAALGMFVPLRVSSIWIALLGFYSMLRDFRSFAATCFLIAGYLWLRSAKPTQPLSGSGPLFKLLLFGGVAATATLITLSLTSGETMGRRAQSDAGRLAAIEIGIEAVKRSPVIGHGSWVEDRELATLFLKRQAELLGSHGAVELGNQIVFTPHSQILHAWVEGGILGTAFFAVLLLHILRLSGWTVMKRPVDPLTPLILYLVISTLWNLFMSPFSAPHRLGIAAGAAVAVLLQMDRRALLRVGATTTATATLPAPTAPPMRGPSAPSSQRRPRRVVMAGTKLRLKPNRRKSLLR